MEVKLATAPCAVLLSSLNSMTAPLAPIKIFLSHASEDKESFVEPLAHALTAKKFAVWYDKFSLSLGDSLLQKISQGLRECNYGVVVLSPAFFAKRWTKAELDGLFAVEDAERKVILPVWKDVTVEDVTAFSPILAGRLAARASEGLQHVVGMIEQAVSTGNKVATFSPEQAIKARFATLSKNINTEQESIRMLSSGRGVQLLRQSFDALVQNIGALVAEIADATGLPFRTRSREDSYGFPLFTLDGPFNLMFRIGFDKLYSNSASDAMIVVSAWKIPVDEWGQNERAIKIRDHYFKPLVLDDLTIQWNSINEVPVQTLPSGQLPAYFMQIVVTEVEGEAERRKRV